MRDERSLYAGARLLAPWGNSAVAMFGFRVPHTRPLVGATANIFYTTTQWGTVVAQTQVRPIRNYARLFHSYLNQLKASTPSSRAPDPYDADMSMDISADVSMQGVESIDVFDISTYGVVTLNEECGLFQWVPNTSPLRPVLMKGYEARCIKSGVGPPLALTLIPLRPRIERDERHLLAHQRATSTAEALPAAPLDLFSPLHFPPSYRATDMKYRTGKFTWSSFGSAARQMQHTARAPESKGAEVHSTAAAVAAIVASPGEWATIVCSPTAARSLPPQSPEVTSSRREVLRPVTNTVGLTGTLPPSDDFEDWLLPALLSSESPLPEVDDFEDLGFQLI
ncbi:hypothetical protein C8F04DRAFT_1275036 [Mycena alexandri]|uniref:Uncharacterized protein n=1 Tax=Mycena alexandri TaxID=1745969 RepID=A0AAD6S431_9AGAR|nr:hypothetical protein C8F04DRAFT_1275036 [Mycena alexandri]